MLATVRLVTALVAANMFVIIAKVAVKLSRLVATVPLVVPRDQILVRGLEAKLAPELSVKVWPWVLT